MISIQNVNGNGNGLGGGVLISGIRADAGPVLITGGAGFIGANLAHRLASHGCRVLIFDNLSRPGVGANLTFLQQTHGSLIDAELGDVTESRSVARAVARASAVFHFAAQVAVTTSLEVPGHDFETNLRGTFNVLEAVRAQSKPPPLLFTSTNKVYGDLCGVELQAGRGGYGPSDPLLQRYGVSESAPLQFHSPYGCSKGASDQYVLDYARCYQLPTVVFRMSCIYGPHQMGTEDQGWVAHFVLRTLRDQTITLYGDGRQVRDLLYVSDLIDAMLLALGQIRATSGQAFNIGGGPSRAVSLLDLLELIERIHGRAPDVHFDLPRVGDQRYYVSDTRKFQSVTGWAPRTSVEDGVAALYQWLRRTPGQRRLAEPLDAWGVSLESEPVAAVTAAARES